MKIELVTLEGAHVRLEPLSESHHAALCEVGFDPELWRLNPTRVTNADEMMAYIRTALAGQAAGNALPFATIDRESNRVVGSTRYMNIDAANRRLEIGSTWIAKPWQRSFVNTEAKYLMLRHAFEALGAIRVELKTDSLNKRSRNAMQRIGATQEGIFRNHMLTWTGRIRHTVYFSIIDSEWPGIKANLESKMSSSESVPLRRVDTLSESQIEDLHGLFQNEWWTKERTMDDIRTMLDATPIQIAFADAASDRLVAFARVLTDRTYKALIFDVIVDSSCRDRGLGCRLMDAILAHPQLSEVKHFELYCKPELEPFYERWGFKEVGDGLRFLRRG